MPLTPDEAALVFRRAAELDSPVLPPGDEVDEQVVRYAAREVGLSEASVDRAVQELRSGMLAPLPELQHDRLAGLLATVAVEGRVDLPADEAARQVEAWLHAQWFERFRTRGREAEWRPRRGVLARTRRGVNLTGDLLPRRVGRLRVCVAPAEHGARVRLVADLSDLRLGLLTTLVGLPAALGGVIAVLVATANGLGPEVLYAVPAAVGPGGLGWVGAQLVLKSSRAGVSEELEHALEALTTWQPARPLHERAGSWAREHLSGRSGRTR